MVTAIAYKESAVPVASEVSTTLSVSAGTAFEVFAVFASLARPARSQANSAEIANVAATTISLFEPVIPCACSRLIPAPGSGGEPIVGTI